MISFVIVFFLALYSWVKIRKGLEYWKVIRISKILQ